MKQEEKELVLKDLCARLPYYVKVAIDFKSYLEWLPDDDDKSEYPYKKNLNTILRCSNKSIDDISQEPHIIYSYISSERFSMLRGYDNREYGVPVEFIKPYLRPMSSMTIDELDDCVMNSGLRDIPCPTYKGSEDEIEKQRLEHSIKVFKTDAYCTDLLDAHHFDCRGLIPMGLALEAPEGMYNIK